MLSRYILLPLLALLPFSLTAVELDTENKQLVKALSEAGVDGSVLNIELTRYANGLRKMLEDNIDVQLEGSKQIKASSNCLDMLGYENSMVDNLKHKIFKSLIVGFDHMDKIDHVEQVERTLITTADLFKLPTLDDCSVDSQKLVNQ
ncbi:hypothetical protein H5185_08595 [Shewanella sp. SG44-6]|jgi:hypothetical protein|uniref:hypothetical protein n=1 Tax=Shewanella sp. SG44-6 TaxID=2760959 RepID=UPI0016001FC8|nr:hypothetical protein [Shewanella sp. SG44-6]MBB1389479.1 hypothetical protein [Shewanella sp. SG44-6]